MELVSCVIVLAEVVAVCDEFGVQPKHLDGVDDDQLLKILCH